jgi:hypothetical protein
MHIAAVNLPTRSKFRHIPRTEVFEHAYRTLKKHGKDVVLSYSPLHLFLQDSRPQRGGCAV